MLLSELLNKYKNKPGSAFARIPDIFNRDESLFNELISSTSFLPAESPITQRFYHVFFNKGRVSCSCGSPLKFSGRFSPRLDNSSANYLNTCDSPTCIFDGLIALCRKNPNSIEPYSFKIKKNEQLLGVLQDRTRFLDEVYEKVGFNQRFYHVWFNLYEIEKCPYCSSPRSFNKKDKFSTDRLKLNYSLATCDSKKCRHTHNSETSKQGCLEKHRVVNISQTDEWREKVKRTNLERYEAEYQTQSNNFKEKTKKTNIEKYGVAQYTQTEEYLSKSINTCLKKYGVNHPTQNKEVMNKVQNTNKIKYGNIYGLTNDDIKKKTLETNLKKYGTLHPMQNASFFEEVKNRSMKLKEFKFPSGNIVKVQGYELYALRDLLTEGFTEEDIITDNSQIAKEIGKIKYTDPSGKIRRYYPDLYVKSLNKVIEVKSSYTYACSKKVNELKRDAVLESGISFSFWVYHSNGSLIEKI